MKRFLFIKIAFAITLLVLAAQVLPASTQDVKHAVETTLQDIPVDNNTPAWELVAGLLLVVLETSFRLIPTTKDISILGFLYRMLNRIIPNKSKEEKYCHTKRRGIRKTFKIKAD